MTFNLKLYEYLRSIEKTRRKRIVTNMEKIGSGAVGTTFTAYIKPVSEFPDSIIVKEESRDKYCENECEALRFLRGKMLANELPEYYIYMYDCFPSGKHKYLLLERADIMFDDFCTRFNTLETSVFVAMFKQLATAIMYLEELKFNHGDLWSENVMLVFNGGEIHPTMPFTIKIIDYDSAYMENSSINRPRQGGANKKRTKFILGYDLSRFFDALLYSYNKFVEKRHEYKLAQIEKFSKMAKTDKTIKKPSLNDEMESDIELQELNKANVMYPQQILNFMINLDAQDENYFNDQPNLAGGAVLKKLAELENV